MSSPSIPKATKPATKATFAVIGAGSWGTALALLLARNGHPIGLWSREVSHRHHLRHERCNSRYLPDAPFPDNLTIIDSLADVAGYDHVLIAVPSHAFKGVLEQLKPYWPKTRGLLWATKGLEPDSGRFLSEIVDSLLGYDTPKALLTGPSFAKEVARGQPTVVTIAGTHPDFNRTMQACFQAKTFRVYVVDDLVGAQLGGAVKNILAIAVGIAEGLGYGTNTKAALMTRGLAEMMRLGAALGAKPETLMGLSGLGDLILTCSDNQSRNRRFGLAVGQGQDFDTACQTIGQVVEGIQTTHSIYNLAHKLKVSMPITEQMQRLLTGQSTAPQVVNALISREVGAE